MFPARNPAPPPSTISLSLRFHPLSICSSSSNPLEKAKMKSPNFSPSSKSCPSSSSAQIFAALLQLPAASPPSAALKLRQSRRRAPERLSLSIPVHNRARLLANGARPSLFPCGSPPRIAPAKGKICFRIVVSSHIVSSQFPWPSLLFKKWMLFRKEVISVRGSYF
ncbi:uncharacterized protein LOC131006004 [Salvia miltiorrhiza]|uniref:uncharacterized protein LOC131006004 n=1 Tax=Salvia miltiorrhiza TaxID=226208 RepID=UPI0025ACED5B|nr:uncharacterized protein LOC131006004 [Salvia miltiorrhiza]